MRNPLALFASWSNLLIVVLLAFSQFTWAQSGATLKTTVPPPLQFHYIGPPPGGRIASVAGIPGNYSTYYLGSASGGLWKSTDGGHTFLPIFDNQDVSGIGAIAVAPGDPNTVWVGTGEPWVIRLGTPVGDGVYKSSDAGMTWQHMGLIDTGRIARIVINPADINNVFVCAEGRLTSPQQERGVYRTTDGGKTWKRVLFVNPHTGCSGLSIDPTNPNILIAGMWQVTQRTWAEDSGGPGSGVYMSHNNGRTWQHLSSGLPRPPLGKIDVAIAPSNPQRMYALIQTKDQGSLWRTDNGGRQWRTVSWDRNLILRAGYYIRIAVSPKNDDDVIITSSHPHYSTNGGLTFSGEGGESVHPMGPASCGDCHGVWIDPDNPAHYVLTDDGGASIATGAGTAIQVSLPNGQIYHVTSDDRAPYWVYGNRQDDAAWGLSSDISQSTGSGLLPKNDFMPQGEPASEPFFGEKSKFEVNESLLAQYPKAAPPPDGFSLGPTGNTQLLFRNGGLAAPYGAPPPAAPSWVDFPNACESGFTLPDPSDPNIIWSSCYGNKLFRIDLTRGTSHSVSPSKIALDSPPNVTKYRCHWTAPVAIDPFDHKNVYYGCQMVMRTTDEGHSWMEFSPDLSTRDPSRIGPSGGVMGDYLGMYDGEVVWSMAFSPIVKGLLWAGTNDGKLWYTRDAESAQMPQWVDVTRNLHLPPWGEINQISPSHFDPGTVYIAVDFRFAGENNYKPYILMTTDYGATWRNIDGDIPSTNPLDYVLSVAENPNRKGMLFAGTGHSFYYSMDYGSHWIRFDKGLPPSPVTWINVQPHMHDVDVSTYGRGVYILPDIAILEQTGSSEPPNDGPTRLFTPSEIYRKARGAYPTVAQPARPQFQFYLANTPEAPVQMQILDAQGTVIRTEKLDAHRGLNGAYWDLYYDPPDNVRLLTTPPENPNIWEEARYQGKISRPVIHPCINHYTGTPIAAPGEYQLRLTVDGRIYTQPFQVIKDPEIPVSDSALRASTALQVQILDKINRTVNMVNVMEQWRKQVEDQLRAHTTGSAAGALKRLNSQILAVEDQLVSPEARLDDDKQFSTPFRVYWNLVWLGAQVGQGGVGPGGATNVAGGSDYEPTVAQRQIFAEIEAELVKAEAEFGDLKSNVLPAFNRNMESIGVTINSG